MVACCPNCAIIFERVVAACMAAGLVKGKDLLPMRA